MVVLCCCQVILSSDSLDDAQIDDSSARHRLSSVETSDAAHPEHNLPPFSVTMQVLSYVSFDTFFVLLCVTARKLCSTVHLDLVDTSIMMSGKCTCLGWILIDYLQRYSILRVCDCKVSETEIYVMIILHEWRIAHGPITV